MSKKNEKAKKEEEKLSKLARLTKLIKDEKVKIEPKSAPRWVNKYRSQSPKFNPRPPMSENVVEAGGMKVDPSLAQEYENWRKDKEREQEERRVQAERARAAKEAARRPPNSPI